MKRVLTAIASGLGLIASIIAIVSARSAIWKWLYPVPLIILLAGALAGLLGYTWLQRQRPTEADQERLDRLLATIPRDAIHRLENEDFATPWREASVYPFVKYVEELRASEEHFDSRSVERRRGLLYEAANQFIWAEAKNGFVHQHRENLRNTGWLLGDLEGDERALTIAEKRASTIRDAAADVIAAYEDLLAVARRKGFDLDAIASSAPVPPWITSAPTP
jgi:hypothetical protein